MRKTRTAYLSIPAWMSATSSGVSGRRISIPSTSPAKQGPIWRIFTGIGGVSSVTGWNRNRSTLMPIQRLSPSLCRRLRQEMLYDLPAGGTPHTFMRADVVESRIESADPMRLAGHEWVNRDRHHARDRFALAVQRIELTPQHRFELGNRNLHFKIGRDVVGLDRI